MNSKVKSKEVPKKKPKNMNEQKCKWVLVSIEKNSEQLKELKMEKCCFFIMVFQVIILSEIDIKIKKTSRFFTKSGSTIIPDKIILEWGLKNYYIPYTDCAFSLYHFRDDAFSAYKLLMRQFWCLLTKSKYFHENLYFLYYRGYRSYMDYIGTHLFLDH